MSKTLRVAEYAFLRDLKGLDDIGLGMLAPSVATEERMRKDRVTAARLALGGYIRGEPPPDPEGPWGSVYYLTTKGLRALQSVYRMTAFSARYWLQTPGEAN